MRRVWIALALMLTLSGCQSYEKQDFTLLPYSREDEILEIVGKTIVNVPVWTIEGALAITVLGMYLAALGGYRR